MNINTQLLAAGVTRWHIVETTRQQNLAEHQFNVAIIARWIAQRLGLNAQDTSTVVESALLHDQHEIMDGDTPSTAKREKTVNSILIPRIVQVADKVEALWFIHARHINRPDVVEDVRQRLSNLMVQLNEDEAAVIYALIRELGIDK